MIVGLTGGIGSGKSTIARLFSILGCAVFNSDEVAKEVYYDVRIKEKIHELLGKRSYRRDGRINKPYISNKIFSDAAVLHQLNGIIHPAVRERTKMFTLEHAGKMIVKESALLYEANLENDVEKVILVAADDDLRLRRVVLRDKVTAEDVMRRMRSQLPQDEKIKKADYIIYNNEDCLVIPQVLEVFKKLK
jgi:dephospho-CoA kinase